MAAKSGVVLPVAPALPAAETTWLAWAGWMAAALPLCLMGYAYYDSLAYMTDLWVNDENYGHGLLVPLISLYLIWQRRDNIRSLVQPGSWLGLVLVGVGILLYVVGELATVYLLLHLSFWCVLVGLLVACLGRPAVTVMAFPLGYLLTAVPLPQFLYQGLSGKLQLISSALGVGCLQFLGITAFRDGNVIDLGPIQLQVVDACSGLRYLFPLATLALLCAYLFNDRMWKRVLLFLSSLPISILLNGFRIGMIGVLVEHFGQGAAEGFYHLFEGWVLFMVSLAILVLEMWLLKRGGGDPSNTGLFQFPASTASGKALSEAAHSGAPLRSGTLQPAFLCAGCLLLVLPMASTQLAQRDEAMPQRQSFLDFPMSIAGWSGTAFPLEARYVEVLRFDDYVLADYAQAGSPPVNLYVAYYRSQRKGQSAHSPQTCIPGGGWEITSMQQVNLKATSPDRSAAPANQVMIQKGDQRQAVLYWFKQRERVVANEYLVKLYMMWDSMLRHRTDGALVRLTTPVLAGESEVQAGKRLLQFAQSVNPVLTRYVPD